MQKNTVPSICTLTTADYDRHLLKQVGEIEGRIQPNDSWNEAVIADLLKQPQNHCWAVLNTDINDKNEAEAIAYCIFSKVFEVAEILRIGTHLNYQRQGLARALIRALINHMPSKELNRIMLEVRADNEPAIALYQKLGFYEIHRRADYYATNDSTKSSSCDALIMQYDRLA